jgi:hypothetical protein
MGTPAAARKGYAPVTTIISQRHIMNDEKIISGDDEQKKSSWEDAFTRECIRAQWPDNSEQLTIGLPRWEKKKEQGADVYVCLYVYMPTSYACVCYLL